MYRNGNEGGVDLAIGQRPFHFVCIGRVVKYPTLEGVRIQLWKIVLEILSKDIVRVDPNWEFTCLARLMPMY